MSSKTTSNIRPTGTHPDTGRRSHIAVAAMVFGMLSAAAVVLLLAAAEMLLAGWFGSHIIATAVLGGVLLIAAVGVYMIWMRRAVARISGQLQTICDVAGKTGLAYDWVMAKLRYMRLLLAVLRSKW